MILRYLRKTIVSGSVIEQIYFEGGFQRGHTITLPHKIEYVNESEYEERKLNSRTRSMRRAKRTLTRTINANVYRYRKSTDSSYPPVFLTLTFKQDIRDRTEANELFSKFIKRLNYKSNKSHKLSILKYSVVVEFQDKTRGGVIHYHVVLYNLPFIHKKVLEKIWGKGFIQIRRIDRVKSVARYVTKYMAKNFEDTRHDGEKRHFSSRELFKPKVYLGDEAFSCIKSIIPPEANRYSFEYELEEGLKLYMDTYTLPEHRSLEHFMDASTLSAISKYDYS